MLTEDQLYDDLSRLVPELGLSLVDCRSQRSRASWAVQVVVYKVDGTGTQDCSAAHRLIQARLEVLGDAKDIRLEVSSPGLDRRLRLPREYPLFIGRAIQVVCKDGREYRGLLADCSPATCTVQVQNKPLVFDFDSLAKVKLDYTQEGAQSWA